MDDREYSQIVDYSYNPKGEYFVVRFLDSSSYMLKIEDLPLWCMAKTANWRQAQLSNDKTSLIVEVPHRKDKIIPYYVIHSRGISI